MILIIKLHESRKKNERVRGKGGISHISRFTPGLKCGYLHYLRIQNPERKSLTEAYNYSYINKV